MDQKVTVKQRVSGFLNFVWNSDNKTLLGRGGRSWAEICFFYLIYYICLASFFAGLLAVFYQTMDGQYPKLMGTDSLLKGNPGVGFKPMPDVDTTLIRYERSDAKQVKPYVDHINKFIKKYEEPKDSDNIVNCSGNAMRMTETTACKVDLAEVIEKCGEDYGYAKGKPCILLKLNKIFDWIPLPYEGDDLPGNMPEDLKQIYDNSSVWIACEGENPGDQDNLGKIEYYPSQGFSMRYYPYRNQKGYLQPLIMAHLKNMVHHVGIMIECKAWARNIEHSRMHVQGSIHFEILVD
ncbi:sodium/potassium-transporting ATPase subunit beta-like [Gigantopelta aegis]|uniref:sodium/potassium-transporting ATPase subunit beta-like n=1 Tax=Gigantopelta aegis TaxID=1735272 RepID=UPI001B88783F|nr:sodium/potassium-transporting ATPase subunit beta-like [Gigantopelta aegis]